MARAATADMCPRWRQPELDTIAAAAVLSLINCCDDAVEEIIHVLLARAHRKFPFCCVERERRAISRCSCRNRCWAGNDQTAPKRMIFRSLIFPSSPPRLLTPFNHAFLSISSVASACDERARKVSTHTCFCWFVFLCKAQSECV